MLLKQFFFILLFSALSLALHIESLGTSKEAIDLDSAKTIFEVYLNEFNKNYQTDEEYQNRFDIFVKNIIFINKRNIEAGSKTYGLTPFTDISWDDFQATHTSALAGKIDASHRINYPSLVKEDGLEKHPPDSWDWVEKGAVTGIKNQAPCDLSWAFTAVGAIEGQYFMIHKQLKRFSEQELMDCITKVCQGPGIDVVHALNYLARLDGLMTEQDYPYESNVGECRLDKTKVAVQVSQGHRMLADEYDLIGALIAVGPISITINTEPGLSQYHGGIYDPPSCEGNYTSMLLVGYGIDGDKRFWKVKNSWGTGWGESGYGRFIRGKKVCGITKFLTTVDIVEQR